MCHTWQAPMQLVQLVVATAESGELSAGMTPGSVGGSYAYRQSPMVMAFLPAMCL